MSEKAGKILVRLWNCVDQAAYADKVDEAFKAIPLKLQKKFIEDILYNNEWDENTDLDQLEINGYKKYVGLDKEKYTMKRKIIPFPKRPYPQPTPDKIPA